MVSRSILEQLGHFDTWGDYTPCTNNSDSKNTLNGSPLNDAEGVKTCWLNQFSALKIFGPDAERFLQGQLTCNVSEITSTNKTAHYGACCTAKGRIVANFNIRFDGENYWLVLPAHSAEILEKHLQKYKVFFKTTIENCQHTHLILGQWKNTKDSDDCDTRHHQTLIISDDRQILVVEDTIDHDTPLNWVPTLEWQLNNINDGIYFVDSEQHEQWIPQHINWHKLNGISFSKGCYTGQEIIARLQYLGKAKKALYHYSAGTDAAYDTHTATQLFDEQGKKQGDILFQRGGEMLTVLNGESPESPLYLTDSQEFPITLQNLPYTDKKED